MFGLLSERLLRTEESRKGFCPQTDLESDSSARLFFSYTAASWMAVTMVLHHMDDSY